MNGNGENMYFWQSRVTVLEDRQLRVCRVAGEYQNERVRRISHQPTGFAVVTNCVKSLIGIQATMSKDLVINEN